MHVISSMLPLPIISKTVYVCDMTDEEYEEYYAYRAAYWSH